MDSHHTGVSVPQWELQKLIQHLGTTGIKGNWLYSLQKTNSTSKDSVRQSEVKEDALITFDGRDGRPKNSFAVNGLPLAYLLTKLPNLLTWVLHNGRGCSVVMVSLQGPDEETQEPWPWDDSSLGQRKARAHRLVTVDSEVMATHLSLGFMGMGGK